MHDLNIITIKQAEAAGREAGHAENDWNDRLASAITAAVLAECGGTHTAEWQAFTTGYLRGRMEG